MDRARATRVLLGPLGFAFLVSVVDHTDSVLNHGDFPQGGAAPAPSVTLVVLGPWAWLRGRITAAAAFLTGYSMSGGG